MAAAMADMDQQSPKKTDIVSEVRSAASEPTESDSDETNLVAQVTQAPGQPDIRNKFNEDGSLTRIGKLGSHLTLSTRYWRAGGLPATVSLSATRRM